MKTVKLAPWCVRCYRCGMVTDLHAHWRQEVGQGGWSACAEIVTQEGDARCPILEPDDELWVYTCESVNGRRATRADRTGRRCPPFCGQVLAVALNYEGHDASADGKHSLEGRWFYNTNGSGLLMVGRHGALPDLYWDGTRLVPIPPDPNMGE